eukprot:15251486-Ditylum_brightwellii.AAC.2
MRWLIASSVVDAGSDKLVETNAVYNMMGGNCFCSKFLLPVIWDPSIVKLGHVTENMGSRESV